MDKIYATMKTMAGIKRKSEKAADGGTGYGGRPEDTKRLVAGRKKAEKASAKDDKANVGYLRQMHSWLQENAIEWQSGLDEDGRKELSKILAETFRNQVPTDWDQRKNLYNTALEVCRTLTTMPSLGGMIFGQKDEPDAVLYWLLDFRQQAKDILNRHLESGWTAEDERDVSLATQVDDVANAALKRWGASKPVAELSVISLSERYQTKLGPLRFDTVDSMQTVSSFIEGYSISLEHFNQFLIPFFDTHKYITALLSPEDSDSTSFTRYTSFIQGVNII